jgi:hypothetical protein
MPTSTQLRVTWHTGSLDMVVLPSTAAKTAVQMAPPVRNILDNPHSHSHITADRSIPEFRPYGKAMNDYSNYRSFIFVIVKRSYKNKVYLIITNKGLCLLLRAL